MRGRLEVLRARRAYDKSILGQPLARPRFNAGVLLLDNRGTGASDGDANAFGVHDAYAIARSCGDPRGEVDASSLRGIFIGGSATPQPLIEAYDVLVANRPIAGPTHDKELPVGRHPLQLYSRGTPNGVKVTEYRPSESDKAVDILTADWANGTTVTLPVTVKPVNTTTAGVHEALESVAKPAVSGPVTITGEDGKATLTPKVIATALAFEPGANGGLNPKMDNAKVVEALRPQLAETEQPGKDASVVLEGGRVPDGVFADDGVTDFGAGRAGLASESATVAANVSGAAGCTCQNAVG